MFSIAQKIQVIDACQVIGEYVPHGLCGTVIAVSDSQGTPIYICKFTDDRILPMREQEIQIAEEVTEP